MRVFKFLGLGLLAMGSVSAAYAESSYDIAAFYNVEEVPKGTKAVDDHKGIVEVKYLLIPTKADTGKFVAEVQKIGDNLYRVKGTDLCVETRYCHEWASFSEKVVLIIESNYGYNKGKIIFD